ncbi:hypothetical protein R3W88_034218 [Solanum pinnatisectum]|uniref:Uncharacterized protein n=1 Tax=Solanum pinnatisectum TaxID=50273 RepID=A0AAV9JZA2_9SOLN|nr:hypothetical protein R3W88_034218 [Solanum pinnatisectum]
MAPTLYLSNHEVVKIIEENRDVMLLKFNPAVKLLMQKKKTHERQHSWDSKATKEIVSRPLY